MGFFQTQQKGNIYYYSLLKVICFPHGVGILKHTGKLGQNIVSTLRVETAKEFFQHHQRQFLFVFPFASVYRTYTKHLYSFTNSPLTVTRSYIHTYTYA